MRGFNVLDPRLELSGRHFLEASAGTGKTFAIEQLIVRLLIEPKGPSLDQILAVTFTRAATSELKARLQQSIQTLLTNILSCQNLPPYLADASAQRLKEARQKLQLALAEFDRASIFTIHGFCFQSLQEHAFDADFSIDQQEENAFSELKRIVKDFLRTGLTEEIIGSKQLEKVMQRYQNDIDLFTGELATLAAQRLPVEGGTPYQQLQEEIKREMARLHSFYRIDSQLLFEDLMQLATLYRGLTNRQRKVKPEIEKGLRVFADLLEGKKNEFIDLPILEMIPVNRLKQGLEKHLHYPGLLDEMQNTLFPSLAAASDELKIIALLADETRKHIESVIEKEDLCFFEDLLRKMAKQVENPLFSAHIRSQYKAVLIDEFQDTDPLQWKIFSTLFLDPQFKAPVYFVGDPKQAIYRFRQADVYTYLNAKQALGKEAEAALNRNFRSQPPLVKALNTLFSAADGFLHLPKIQKALPCAVIEAALPENGAWEDGKGSLHAFMAENEAALFRFIVEEIAFLHQRFDVPYQACAVLVKDRYQAERFLRACPLPAVTKKNDSLLDTPAFLVMQELLEAALDPRDKNRLAAVLCGPFFGYSLEQLPTALEKEAEQFYAYRHLLETEGIFPFFNQLIERQGKKLIGREGGERLYQDLLQLVELLAEDKGSKEDVLSCLERLKQEDPESERLKRRATGQEDAIQVMTIHVSKGLEFSVVFPIGLVLASLDKRSIVRSLYKEALVLSDTEAMLHQQESEAEKMRQLYVAFTRAKKRLYLLALQNGKEGAPITRFLNMLSPPLEALAEKNPEITLATTIDKKSELPKHTSSRILFAPPLPALCFPPIKVHSFSSLSETSSFEAAIGHKENTGLPLGRETGIHLHTLLEKLPFEKAFQAKKPADLIPLITPLIKNMSLEPWVDAIAEMLFKTLHTPLPGPVPFPLAAVDPASILKEMEFLYASEESNGFIKGFVDLFFEHEGHFYFLDWKSNCLEDYSEESLAEEIARHDYDLQAKLYREALNRYLHLFTDQQIKSAFYVFLRGVDGKGEGIYSFL